MNLQEFRDKIDGVQYGQENQFEDLATQHGFVYVFGWSDDCCELRGAIHEEISCWGGGTFYFDKTGGNFTDEEGNACLTYYSNKVNLDENWISVISKPSRHNGGEWAMFCYESNIPHLQFKVYEGSDLYCRGMVFSIKDLQ